MSDTGETGAAVGAGGGALIVGSDTDRLGQNVFAVAPEQARLNLLRVPWIESASVRRTLPGSYANPLQMVTGWIVAVLALMLADRAMHATQQ